MKVRNGLGAKTLSPLLAVLMVMGALTVVSPSASAVLTEEWTLEPPMDGVRAQAAVVQSDDGIVYVMGGIKDALTYAAVPDAIAYDLATGVSTQLAPMPVGVRGAAGAMGTDGRVYVISGVNASRVVNTQIYDPDSDTWSAGTDIPLEVWNSMAAATYDGRIWVVGGENAGSRTEVQVYDIETDSWGAGTAMPVATLGGSMVSIGSYLYLFGGSTSGYVALDTCYRYYIWGGTWTELSPMPEARAAHTSVLGIDNLIYIVGGSNYAYNTVGSVENTTFIYNPSSNEWSDGPALNVPRKYLGAASSADGTIYAVGGNNETDALDVVESILLYEYEIEISSSSVRAGDSVLISADANFAYAEKEDSWMYWYLISSDSIVYAIGEDWNPLPSATLVEVAVPEYAEPGEYTVVIVEWEIDLTSGYVSIMMIELPLTVLPAEPLEGMIDDLELQIADLEAQIDALETQLADLQSQADELNDSMTAADAALMADIAALASDIADLNAAMEAGDEDLMDEIAALQGQLSALQTELNSLMESLDRTENSVDDVQASVDNKMDGALGLAIIGLLVVVILLLVVMMVMGRKPKSMEPQPPEQPLE